MFKWLKRKKMIPMNIPLPPDPWNTDPYQAEDDEEAIQTVAEIIRKQGQTVEEVADRIRRNISNG